ncbi:TRAP transporter 4TM/12TM fusion protein [Natrialba hulunbeirensis JCM 10989]|uniref:TRAP transporter 4TM/12TM fusion protein n=1 Tax=Natrialba hulunbeirensis JCM 10989 TaxID=1227493 RepID=M0A4F5_9EURY|nr:TRAP transporter fused permease subunit [Natrialba hulunbeirensis]ELY93444.1 TRAP transporter 4TM/12TM fusion protein [Natrialba hulunbeirensis JCM 10989]
MSTNTKSLTDFQDTTIRSINNAITVGAVIFWVAILVWAYTQSMTRARFAVVFLGGILFLYILNEATESIADEDYIDLLILAACASVMIVACAYLFTNFEDVYINRQGWALEHEYHLAWMVVAVILYLTWRSYGKVFLGLVGGAMLYALFGQVTPGIFSHAGINSEYMLQVLITDLAGFFGSLTQLTAALIAPFLLYAGLLFAYGAFDLILRMAIVSAKYIESGVAQTAVLASAIIGSVNGSYAANAGMTGSFTIPTMMDSGLRPRTAAAIEGTASTSGQVLPPVMGASAFVMASFLGIAYVDVIVAGLLPAAILVASIVVAVHYTSIREVSSQDLEFDDLFEERLSRTDKIVEGIRFGIPFAVLITMLGVLQWTVPTSAFWTVISMVVLGIGTPVLQSLYLTATGKESTKVQLDDSWSTGSIRPAFRSVREYRVVDAFVTEFWNTVGGFRRGAIILAPIAIILAAVNGVVDLLMVTGVPSKIALMLMDISGGVLLIAVILGMLVCVVMGVGMPTVAAYVITSTLVAPAFVNDFGVPELAAHYMVFYAAVMAGVTPPVAIAVVVASGIAESNFWETCATAMTIAAPLFVLPLSFIYHPEIVSTEIGTQSLIAASAILLGAITMIYGLNYPFRLDRRYKIPIRFGLFWLGAFIMVYPDLIGQLAGIAIFVAIFFTEKYVSSDQPVPGGSSTSR